MKNKILAASAAAALVLTLSACEDNPTAESEALKAVNADAANRKVYTPTNDVEFDNYNRAQQLYDSPEAIIWCTTTWGNASAPLVTVPVAGKLTSSSVSYFPNTTARGNANGVWLEENRSVDGMYHGTPPGYRYGFTPGGQYLDFFNMPTFCTTSLTEFQRQETMVSVANAEIDTLQADAEKALAAGNQDEAQRLLEKVASEGGQ